MTIWILNLPRKRAAEHQTNEKQNKKQYIYEYTIT